MERHIDSRLEGFEISQKPSSNVEYFGSNGKDTIFIQFKNGSSYIYENVDKATIDEMNAAESIGKFISALSKKYAYTKIEKHLVTVVEEVKE